MAGVFFTVCSGLVATGTTAKTILQVRAPSNRRAMLWAWHVSFQGIDPDPANNVRVRLGRLTGTSGGTFASTLTPVKWNSADDETVQTTAVANATVEPAYGGTGSISGLTVSKSLHWELCSPQSGVRWRAGPHTPPFTVSSALGGQQSRIAIEVLTAVNMDCVAWMLCEE